MIWIVMPILIVLMFLLGTDLNKDSFTNVARNPRAVIIGMTGQLLILPVIAFVLACLLKLPPVYFMGIMLIACCPGGSSSNVFSMLAKGDVALSVTLTAISSIVTQARGTGIGLAVCDEIVELHGGTLTLENAQGGGTLVTVRLPAGET